MAQTIHLLPDPQGGWLVKGVGASNATHFDSWGEAEKFGRQISLEQNADFEIHHLDGRVTREKLRRERPERHH